MGLLDDAIREHLDLKRRHGADPTEVERAEREALGPVRRAPETGPGVQAEAERPTSPFAYDQEDDGWEDDDSPHVAAPRTQRQRESEPDLSADAPEDREVDDEPQARPSRLARIFGKPEPEAKPEYDDELEPEDADEVKPHPARDPAGAETAVHHVEEEPAPSETTSDEDVLEETPEFLQDTPDHDRLWFEQRPPRDFDLDS
jgi:hypothetical protein